MLPSTKFVVGNTCNKSLRQVGKKHQTQRGLTGTKSRARINLHHSLQIIPKVMIEAIVGVCKVSTAAPFLEKGGEVAEKLNRCIISNILGNNAERDQRSKEERQETSTATYSFLTLVLLVPPPSLFFPLDSN